MLCRDRYPGLRFETADAADLSLFADATFDAIVFSFNGLDYLAPDEKRRQCLSECSRVLKEGGVFIFSCHNPHSLMREWQCDWNRLRIMADRVTGGRRLLSAVVFGVLACGRMGLEFVRRGVDTVSRSIRRIPTRMFWLGDGYLFDPSHGGLWTHLASQGHVIAELNEFRFELLEVVPDDYPRKSLRFSTRWFYYAFCKQT